MQLSHTSGLHKLNTGFRPYIYQSTTTANGPGYLISVNLRIMVYQMIFNVDGGCRRNGRFNAIGAAACCLERSYGRSSDCRTRSLSRQHGKPRPTNQRAEITAIIMALEWALVKYDTLRGTPELQVTIYSDSQYAVSCMNDWIYKWCTNGWLNSRGYEVVNRDLIERASRLDDLVADLGSVDYVWIRREDNETADELCRQRLDEQDGLR